MTKQEALQKIEELKQFVVDLDSKEKELGHGDIAYYSGDPSAIRITIDARQIRNENLNYRYLVFDKSGELTNFFNDLSDVGTLYSKIKNVFED